MLRSRNRSSRCASHSIRGLGLSPAGLHAAGAGGHRVHRGVSANPPDTAPVVSGLALGELRQRRAGAGGRGVVSAGYLQRQAADDPHGAALRADVSRAAADRAGLAGGSHAARAAALDCAARAGAAHPAALAARVLPRSGAAQDRVAVDEPGLHHLACAGRV